MRAFTGQGSVVVELPGTKIAVPGVLVSNTGTPEKVIMKGRSSGISGL